MLALLGWRQGLFSPLPWWSGCEWTLGGRHQVPGWLQCHSLKSPFLSPGKGSHLVERAEFFLPILQMDKGDPRRHRDCPVGLGMACGHWTVSASCAHHEDGAGT